VRQFQFQQQALMALDLPVKEKEYQRLQLR